MPSPFTAKTITFLRALKRNNTREWFRARKDDYEQHVRGPMVQLLDRLAGDFATFAPEIVSDPKVSLYRIYRDTRFSADKTPLKTHVSAHFPTRGFPRGQGAGLYIEIAPQWVWIGGGLYLPSTPDLQAIRGHIAATHPRLHRVVKAPAFTRVMGELHGERLTRVPLGYAKDHPAAHYLQFKQFLASREFEAKFATSPGFYRELVRTFRAMVPLVRFLNAPLLEHVTPAPHPLDEALRRDLARSARQRQAPAPMW
jgi:uncharacterized protein (TIGR02453 family)